MRTPIPDTPSKLQGSFMSGILNPTGQEVVLDVVRRVELTPELDQRRMQAQRAIGALMALTAFHAEGVASASFQKLVFARLAELTGMGQVELVTCAGVAR